jgi:hypothetical protein
MDLRDIWEQELLFDFSRLLERQDLKLTADHTDYVFVDGEEGDFGTIRYKDATGAVVAVKTIEGGDVDSLELTDYGKPIVAAALMTMFKDTLSRKLNVTGGALPS